MDRPPQRQTFEEVSTTPLGVQEGFERFPGQGSADIPFPRLESWRCNLTALSHIHNLYFVASAYSILVYEPNFPDQKLSVQPSLVLSPCSATASDNPGWSPLGDSRTINHLLVDFLGNDEALLVALHNGRVVGYYVNQIQWAIDHRREMETVTMAAVDPGKVRPFFSETVASSAWGLAVHQEARMIAVSCNSHTVTVFALALTKDSGENIPGVAFCNTGEDPDGRWVLASDINGYSRVIDLARCCRKQYPSVNMHSHRFCAMANVSGQKQCACHHLERDSRSFLHATWGVMWLDARAFKRTKTVSEALGSEGFPLRVERMSSTLNCYDNSNNRQRVHNSSTVYGTALLRPVEYSNASSEDDTDDDGEQQHAYQHDIPDTVEPVNTVEIARGIELRRVPRNPGGITWNQIRVPTSPILRLSVKDVFLIQPHNPRPPERPPVGFFDPFFQQIRQNPHLARINVHDRINLYAQIVELGLVIIGSAKGRAAVVSLTQTDDEESERGRPWYGCRIDWILPFQNQEEAGQRPVAPLVGLAAGPIQGMLGRRAQCSRRWRLLLMYADNSVLSYELGKSREGTVALHEFGGLVV